jgi:hypothetical protein
MGGGSQEKLESQALIKYEEVGGADVRSYEPKVFSTFEQECRMQIDPKTYIAYSVRKSY